VTYFGEITFNAQPNRLHRGSGAQHHSLRLQRLFQAVVVRYHTPVGYWNTAFHHGAWLQTTISRPDMVRFGGTFIPVHFVGFPRGRQHSFGRRGPELTTWVGNGRGSIISRPGDAGDINNNRAWVANVYSRPRALYGLSWALRCTETKSLWRGGISGSGLRSAHRMDERVAGILANLPCQPSRRTDRSLDEQPGLLRAAWLSPALVERTVKPYYRLNILIHRSSEQVFTNQDLVGSTLGVRYDITTMPRLRRNIATSTGNRRTSCEWVVCTDRFTF